MFQLAYMADMLVRPMLLLRTGRKRQVGGTGLPPSFLSLAVVVNALLTKCISLVPKPSPIGKVLITLQSAYFKLKCMHVTPYETAALRRLLTISKWLGYEYSFTS